MKVKIILGILTIFSFSYIGSCFAVLENDLQKLNGNLTTLNQELKTPAIEKMQTWALQISLGDTIIENITPTDDFITNILAFIPNLDLIYLEVPTTIDLDTLKQAIKNLPIHSIQLKNLNVKGPAIIADNIEYRDKNNNIVTQDTIVTTFEKIAPLKPYIKKIESPQLFPTQIIVKTYKDKGEADKAFATFPPEIKNPLIINSLQLISSASKKPEEIILNK